MHEAVYKYLAQGLLQGKDSINVSSRRYCHMKCKALFCWRNRGDSFSLGCLHLWTKKSLSLNSNQHLEVSVTLWEKHAACFPQRPGQNSRISLAFCKVDTHLPMSHFRIWQFSGMWLTHQSHRRKWNTHKIETMSQKACLKGLERKWDLSNGGQLRGQPSLQE